MKPTKSIQKLWTIALIMVAIIAIAVPSFGQDSLSVEPFEVVEISGEISYGDKGMEAVLVELFEGNKVIEAFETKKNGKFKFALYSAEIYTIQLSKKGYYTKRISVNTSVPAEYEDFSKFQFDIGMTSKEDASYDAALSEYPSALISFDQRKEEFTYDKNYTKSYFDEIEAAK